MIRVIVVDDHPVVRRGLRQMIEAEEGMKVVGEAGNGREAITIIRRTACDIVTLDIALPDVNGIEVFDQLHHEQPKLHVLIMSVYEEEQYAQRMLRAGAAGYLMKDSAPEELIQAIRRIAGGGRYISSSLADILASETAFPERSLHEKLSDREFQVLCLIASGKRLKNIAEALCISDKTVSTYRFRILEKMRMKTNADIVAYVLKNNLTQ